MVVSYRLIGVDGEAEEEIIETVEEESNDAGSKKTLELSKKLGEAGLRAILQEVETHILDSLRIARRDNTAPSLSTDAGTGLELLTTAMQVPINRAILTQVRRCEEQSDELTRLVDWTSTRTAGTSVCKVAAANFYAISNITIKSSIATHFARRSSTATSNC